MLGDWKCDCTSRTLVDSALPGSQYFRSFFSAPVSFLDSGKARTSMTTQKPTTTHLVQLPAGISAIFLSLLIDAPRFPRAVAERLGLGLVPTMTAGGSPGIREIPDGDTDFHR